MHKKDHFSSFEKKINFNLVDYSTYSDTQDLLIISDILITNYSSIIWDYSLMFKEGYLYVPDLKKYRLKRNFYIDIKNWPYPICKNFRNLIDAMKDYDSFKAHDKIKLHHKNLSSYESGKSCLLIENEIKNLMEE
jgi:CDP-glycerol glycerophosphotransferase